MPESDTVSLEIADEVATVTVDRPEKLNSLNVETLEALQAAIAEAEDAGPRALVLTGAGEEAFIAGADISYMKDLDTPEAQAYAELGHDIARSLETFSAPSIAAVNGYAFGGGCELALACDLRVAAENAVFGQTEIDLGIVPGWGGTQRLPRLVDDEVARRLILFGERIDATDAHEYGLVGEVVAHDQLESRIDDLTADLAAQPQFALAAAKEAINASYGMSLEDGLTYEKRVFSGLFGTPDQREGMDAFANKREPDFE
ncbi:enoyl-CoA hydratase/isomerase family protein [Halobaculum halobium]|uniref:Enoyl-CoA hydratase/isomerase family protein n=1 Tax=Halobaculum halobium TaxID=3032281 RepID=A0ABD5TEB2_9EURY|nr:enoyl-CoA hydratase-related protein [Halobaculum sp. SYNS20]